MKMENIDAMEQKRLIAELTRGREVANQLKNHLDAIASNEPPEHLVQKIISSYDKALEVLINYKALLQEPSSIVGPIESPQSIDGVSPKSEGGSCSDSKDQCKKSNCKKRKTLPRWSEQVRVCSGTGLEGPLDDGYSWRKYGQKDILGTIHPRAYYRCTHRHTKCCQATKQVQRSDEDPSILEVTYRGRHSCVPDSQANAPIVSTENEKVESNRSDMQKQLQETQGQEQETFWKYRGALRVKTEGLDKPDEPFPAFSFPSTPIKSENLESQCFSEPLKESIFLGSYSPGFISPETSESDYFTASPSRMNNFGIGQNWQSPESDLTDIISTPTSVTFSPFEGLDFSIDQFNFDPDFPLDNPEYFS